MAYDLQFVDQISSTPTVRLNLNARPWKMRVGTEFGMPELRRAAVQTLLVDGDRYPAAAYGNRMLSLLLRVDGVSDDDNAAQLQKLYRELDRPTNTLLYRPGTTAPVFFRTFRCGPDAVTWDPFTKEVRVQVPAEPFALGLRETLPAVRVYNDPSGQVPISDSFTRTVASNWGVATSGESWLTEGGNTTDHAVNGSAGTHSAGVASSSRRASVGGPAVDWDVTTSVATDKLAVGGSLNSSAMLRYIDVDNMILFQARATTSAAVQARIITRIAGVEADQATIVTVPGLTHQVGVPLRVRAQAVGTLLRLKVWLASGSEPSYWHMTALSSTWLIEGKAGVRSFPETGASNLPVVFSYDNFTARAGTPQIAVAGVARQDMPVWRAAAERATVAPVTVVVVGSSTAAGSMGTMGSDTPKRATTMWGAILRARHNAAGVPGGYGVSVANIGIANEWNRSGGVNVLNRGLGFTGWQMAAGEFVSRPWYGTAVTILFEQGPGAGAFQVQIDGGATTTVTPNAAAARNTGRWTSPTLTVGSHSVKITAVGTCVIEAVYGHDRDTTSGVQVWNGGLPGVTTTELAATPGLIARLGEMAPSMVVLMQTSNDYASGTDPAVVKQRISTWLGQLFAAAPGTQVMLVHHHLRFDVTSPAYPWSQYGQILAELAAADPTRVAYVDVSALFPTSQVADTSDLVDTDSVHLTERGHQLLADALAGVTADLTGSMCLDVNSPTGDVETPLFLSVEAETLTPTRGKWTTGYGRRQTALALRRGGTPSDAPVVLTAESMETLVDTTMRPAGDGASGQYARVDFVANPGLDNRLLVTAWPQTPSEDARGQYRAFARVRKTVASDVMQLLLQYKADDAFVVSDLATLPDGAVWRWVDLGLVQMPLGYDPATDGLSGVPLQVRGPQVNVLAARLVGTGSLDIDSLLFLPADDRFCAMRWPEYGEQAAYILDSAANHVYGVGADGAVRGSLPELEGLPPMVSPGMANRMWVVRDVGRETLGGDDNTAATRIVPYYWPRYLHVRPAGELMA